MEQGAVGAVEAVEEVEVKERKGMVEEEERGKGGNKEGRKGEKTLRRSRDLDFSLSYSRISFHSSSLAYNSKHLS